MMGEKEGRGTYALSQRLAENKRWIARSSSSDVCVRYELIILPIVVVRSVESGRGMRVSSHVLGAVTLSIFPSLLVASYYAIIRPSVPVCPHRLSQPTRLNAPTSLTPAPPLPSSSAQPVLTRESPTNSLDPPCV